MLRAFGFLLSLPLRVVVVVAWLCLDVFRTVTLPECEGAQRSVQPELGGRWVPIPSNVGSSVVLALGTTMVYIYQRSTLLQRSQRVGKTTAVLLQRSVCRAVSVREEECETMLEGFAKLPERKQQQLKANTLRLARGIQYTTRSPTP